MFPVSLLPMLPVHTGAAEWDCQTSSDCGSIRGMTANFWIPPIVPGLFVFCLFVSIGSSQVGSGGDLRNEILQPYESLQTLEYEGTIETLHPLSIVNRARAKGNSPTVRSEVRCVFSGDQYFASVDEFDEWGKWRRSWKSAFDGEAVQIWSEREDDQKPGGTLLLVDPKKQTFYMGDEGIRMRNLVFEPFRFLRRVDGDTGSLPVRSLADFHDPAAIPRLGRDVVSTWNETLGDWNCRALHLRTDLNDPFMKDQPIEFVAYLASDLSYYPVGWDMRFPNLKPSDMATYRVTELGKVRIPSGEGAGAWLYYPKLAIHRLGQLKMTYATERIVVNEPVDPSVFSLDRTSANLVIDRIHGVTVLPRKGEVKLSK